ncbi:efflux RND transporter periplasmic adaptor subunit [Marinobacter sp. chi1]|uniref:Efflux RND transporter periplasmic adaptor subunit n=1 Tax=Marinobacter suaedae TaxID=3057675 RepID=A0ABT8VZE0_9GAMM|nr:efflux RND transporter periplasmic adaptor subunit [Marinobacter sp. chi1]MDO3721352.1 efflux RND transporter periplasmic adaptor subunit [Marinobacter sp. chi1]
MSNSVLTPARHADKRSEERKTPEFVEAPAFDRVPANSSPRVDGNPSANKVSAELARKWLAWQCRMVTGLIRGALYLPENSKRLGAAVSWWPEKGEGESLLVDAAAQALAGNRSVVRSQQHYGPDKQRVCELIATPFFVDNKPVAVVAVLISPRSVAQQKAVLQLLQWGGLWMKTLVQQHSIAQREAGTFALRAMTAILRHPSSHTAAIETVNQLANQFRCERVSIGFRQGLPVRLQAMSHMASFDPRTQMVRRTEAAMEEAVDQGIAMIWPTIPGQNSVVSRAHAELANQPQSVAVCTIPLRGRSKVIGAVTLERDLKDPFDEETVALCQSLVAVVGPALESKIQDERSFWLKGIEAFKESAASVFGTSFMRLKVVMLTALVLFGALSLVDGTYEMTSPASIEGAVRQVLVSPQDGYVKSAGVRAGDVVTEGQSIALLDDRDLQLERQKWQSEYNKLQTEYQEALAESERVTLSVLRAQLDQVNAEIQLVEERIKRTQLRAPFDGVVVTGDLSQSVGAPVETGEVLYEVAPLESYRVVLEVDERDMAGVEKGKTGRLIISALPETTFDLVIDQVVPVAVSSDSRNFFRVEASLEQPAPMLRPGMRGVAKVDMGQRSLLWIWTHSIVDRVRLWFWAA